MAWVTLKTIRDETICVNTDRIRSLVDCGSACRLVWDDENTLVDMPMHKVVELFIKEAREQDIAIWETTGTAIHVPKKDE